MAFITLADIEDEKRFNEEIFNQIRKHKRALRRERSVSEREVHVHRSHKVARKFADEQLEAYLRYGQVDFSEATF